MKFIDKIMCKGKPAQQGEDLFGKLTKSDGSPFSGETVLNWYRARHYVLNVMPPIDVEASRRHNESGCGIGVNSSAHVDVVVEGDSGLMLAVARQIALVAYFPNYGDGDGNRTCITILCRGALTAEALTAIEQKICGEECLCNLPRYAKLTMSVQGGSQPIVVKNADSFIDVAIHLVGVEQYGDFVSPETSVRIAEADVVNALRDVDDGAICLIDTAAAKFVNMAYSIGAVVDNLPCDDPFTAERYATAINVFRYHSMIRRKADAEWEKMPVRNRLSNVFCADCFDSRLRSIGTASVKWDWHSNINLFISLVAKHLKPLSHCEHSRWNVEKLILGFRPLSAEERFRDNMLLGGEKRAYRAMLKKMPVQPAHIDLCSYADLRRVDPGNMKYDSFLVLAMPFIKNKIMNKQFF
ncbi:MAG: hypothetical protein ACI4AH_04550 [Muribaculaceae bacterium]